LLQTFTDDRRGATPFRNLFQVVHQVQVGERATVFVDIVFAVGGDEDRADVGDAGDIRRDELFPKLLVAAGQLQPVHGRRNLAEPVDEQRSAVAGPCDGSFTRIKAGNW